MSQTATREERRSALDDFAAPSASSGAMVPATVLAPALDHVHGAQSVAVRRDESQVLVKLKMLAAAAGNDWFYRLPFKDRKSGKTSFVEGPSIKLSNDLARIYGNCEVDCRAQDAGDAWLFHARFVDLETGFSLTRPFQQRKSGSRIGGGDDDRRLDIAFQIGASKAIRNVVVNALQTFADFALDEAREALVDKIESSLDKWRRITLERLHGHVTLDRVEAVIGRTASEWLAPDVAKVIAMMKAVVDGMATIDETFPPLKDSQKEAATAELDAFAKNAAPAAGVVEGGASGIPPAIRWRRIRRKPPGISWGRRQRIPKAHPLRCCRSQLFRDRRDRADPEARHRQGHERPGEARKPRTAAAGL